MLVARSVGGYYEMSVDGACLYACFTDGRLIVTNLAPCTFGNMDECKRICERHRRAGR